MDLEKYPDAISKVATLLIEKISEGIGGSFRPFQIVRIAKAESKAAIIKAKSEIEITGLHERAYQRFLAEESTKQLNIENILLKTIPLLNENSNPTSLDNEWILNYIDKCKFISDLEMQTLWAKILNEEISKSKSFSKRTINAVSEMSKTDAEIFTSFSRFIWKVGDTHYPMIYYSDDEIYKKSGLHLIHFKHLQDIGLISTQIVGGYRKKFLSDIISLKYYNESPIVIERFGKHKILVPELYVGFMMFTQTGAELYKICGAKPLPEYYEHTINNILKHNEHRGMIKAYCQTKK